MIETFTDRFNRLTADYDDSALATITGLKYNTIRDIRNGKIKSIKLDAALFLCRKLGLSPWTLQGISPPPSDIEVVHGNHRFAVYIAQIAGSIDPSVSLVVREKMAGLLNSGGIKAVLRRTLADRTRPAADAPYDSIDLPVEVEERLAAMEREYRTGLAEVNRLVAESQKLHEPESPIQQAAPNTRRRKARRS